MLNVAEGNGRFSHQDQLRFLDIAYTSAMGVAAGLDLAVSSGKLAATAITEGKALLACSVALLLGLRRYVEKKALET